MLQSKKEGGQIQTPKQTMTPAAKHTMRLKVPFRFAFMVLGRISFAPLQFE